MQLSVPYQKTLLCLVLLTVTFALYWPALDDEFVWDAAVLHQDPSLGSLSSLFSGFTAQAMQGAHDNGQGMKVLKYYRPFTKALHVLEHQLFGADPFPYKLINITLHGTVAVLLFSLVASIQASLPVAFFAALLFLVKPIHTEAVAWTYSDSYLLVAVLALVSLLALRRKNHSLALAAFSLALLSHEMGVLLLPIVVLYVTLVEQRTTRGGLLALVPYVLITLAFLALRRWIVGPLPLSAVEPLAFVNTAAFVFAKYLRIFLWPDAPVTLYLQALYPTPNAYVVAGYLLLLLCGWIVWLLWRRDRVLLFWFLWFFIWSAVSYNIGSFGEYLLAEKIIYLASAGLGVVVVALLLRGFSQYPSLVYAGLAGVALAYAVNTSRRLPYWQDTHAYLVKALEYAPAFPAGWYTLANVYREESKYDQALTALEQAVVHNPDFSLALNNIGNIHFIQGRIPQAAEYWQRAVRSDPTNPQPYYNIGMAMQRMGKPHQALEYYEQYLVRAEQPDPGARQSIDNLRRSLAVDRVP